MYKVIIFTTDGRDNHHMVTAENLDSFILRAIWISNFHHLSVFEAVIDA